MSYVQVTNEIGALRRAIVHRPGRETQQTAHGDFFQAFPLRPGRSSFDLEQAQREHDALVGVLKNHEVEVIEVCDALQQTLEASPEARQELVDAFVADSPVEGAELTGALRDYFLSQGSPAQLVQALYDGVRYGQTNLASPASFPLAQRTDTAFDPELFLSRPINTSFFVRDPVTAIGRGLTCNSMYWRDRTREVDLYQILLRHLPAFSSTPQWLDHSCSFHIEGGDLINLTDKSLAIGLSSRTEGPAIDVLARHLLWGSRDGAPSGDAAPMPASDIKDIYVIPVPGTGNRLHLDTYLARVDYDTFLMDRSLAEQGPLLRLHRGRKKGEVRIEEERGGLKAMLKRALHQGPLKFIEVDGTDSSLAAELAGEAIGVLCLAPGVLCVSQGNLRVNDLLEKAGLDIIAVPTIELTDGFGGPGSLVLPLWRETVE